MYIYGSRGTHSQTRTIRNISLQNMNILHLRREVNQVSRASFVTSRSENNVGGVRTLLEISQDAPVSHVQRHNTKDIPTNFWTNPNCGNKRYTVSDKLANLGIDTTYTNATVSTSDEVGHHIVERGW